MHGGNTEGNAKRRMSAEQAQRKELWAVSDYLENIRFKSRMMGVDEADVWEKIEKLCELYEAAISAEQGRCRELEKQLRNSRGGMTAEEPADE